MWKSNSLKHCIKRYGLNSVEKELPDETDPLFYNEPKVLIPDQLERISNSTVTWEASAKASVRVKELKRTCEEYMALPASQYSVLSASQITRLSESEFKYTLGTLNFFGTKITPILYVTVNVYPEQAKSEIIVSRAETVGSEIANIVNGTFEIQAVNVVSAGFDNKGRKTLNSETSLKIDAVVPKTKISLPTKLVQSGGNFVMQSTLNVLVPTFVRILAADFKRWSAGDDSRTAVEGAKMDVP
jgi:hypothetical protein